MSKLASRLAVLAAFFLCLGVSNANAALAVIAHPSNPLEGLSADAVAMIYLGKTDRFPDGQPVTPVDQNESSQARKRFYEDVVQKNPTEMETYWSKLIFTGKGQPPEVVGDDQAVKAWVASHPNALGYVDGRVLDRTVKVLLIIP